MAGLHNGFYTQPTLASEVMRTKQLQDLLMATDGVAIIKGSLWDIKHKRIGPGVYRVHVERQKMGGKS